MRVILRHDSRRTNFQTVSVREKERGGEGAQAKRKGFIARFSSL